MFWAASENNINLYADSVSEFIRKCIGDVVLTVAIKTYPNQKTWMDGSILAKLKVWTTAFNHAKMTGNEIKNSVVIPSARHSNKWNVGIGTKWSLNSMSQTRDVCVRVHRQLLTTSHVTDTDILLPDKLNTFFAHFEDNTVPPTQPANKDCGDCTFLLCGRGE